MGKLFLGCLAALVSVVAIGAKPTLDESFGETGVSIGIGSKNYEGAQLVGDNCGSVFFDLSLSETQAKRGGPRNLMCLRTGGRTHVMLITFGNRSFQFSMTDYDKTYRVDLPDRIEYERVYRFGVTWDGESMRLYLDGRVIRTSFQVLPLALKNIRKINFGPFKDGYLNLSPWADDVTLHRVRTWNVALSPKEVVEDAGLTFNPIDEEMPSVLEVARLPAGIPVPVVDGKADEKSWDHAASMPQLVCRSSPGKSGEMPEHGVRLAYDETNLYLLATTRLPGRIPYVEGAKSGDADIDHAESWKLQLKIGGHDYWFGAVASGGTAEACDGEVVWKTDWRYAQTKAMRIDDSIVWTAEAAIPWSGFGLTNAPADSVRIDFVRNWTLKTFIDVAEFGAMARFNPCAVYRLDSRTDPACGSYEEGYSLTSDCDCNVVYELHYGTRDGSQAPFSAYRRGYRMKAGEMLSDKLKISTKLPGYDVLVHTLIQDEKVVMRAVIPYDLREQFAVITPLLLDGKVRVAFKKPFVGKVEISGPAGENFGGEKSNGSDLILPFLRDWPKGEYKVRLVKQGVGLVSETRFNYPGRGEWERQDFHKDWILPSFDPIVTEVISNGFISKMYAKVFGWKVSFLPKQIKLQGVKAFAETAELLVDGVKMEPTDFVVTSNCSHHVGFAATNATVSLRGWLEYDGIFFNHITVMPNGKGEVKIRYAMPAALAKYCHCSSGSGWGAKRTFRVSDGEMVLGSFPTMWLGDEEKGLCFFYETRWNWTASERKAYVFEKRDGRVYVTVNIADALPVGKPFSFEFGFVGTPMRKLAPNYPFDTLGESYYATMNRPGCRPTCDVSELTADDWNRGSDLGSFFGDLPTPGGRIKDENIRFVLNKYEKGRGTRPISYTCARHLSVMYPEVAAYLPSWTFRPEVAMDYTHTGHVVYDCCPTTTANDFFMWKFRQQLKRHPELMGIYLDFGVTHVCSNEDHGCREKTTLLGQREFYRRLCVVQVEMGIKNPVVVIHNTDCVQVPAVSFVSHFLNGEHIRQASSPILHQKKDILDTYGIEMFASELSTLPWGVSNAAYFPFDRLLPANGGNETSDLYKFRMNKATMGSCLVHNTMHAMWRCHFGFFDKIVRYMDAFGVAKTAKFVGYWKKPASVKGADDVYVSFWTDGTKLLAVIAHIGKSHEDRDVEIILDPKVLGLAGTLTQAKDLMPADDSEYHELYEMRKMSGLTNPLARVPLDLGEFGTRVDCFDGVTLKYHLPFHSFGLVEIK